MAEFENNNMQNSNSKVMQMPPEMPPFGLKNVGFWLNYPCLSFISACRNKKLRNKQFKKDSSIHICTKQTSAFSRLSE